MHFKLMPHDSSPACVVKIRNLLPVEFRYEIGDLFTFHVGLQSEKTRHCLVEIKYPPILIHNQDPVLNCVEQRFQKAPLPREPLDDVLQALPVESRNSAKDFIEKTGFCGHGFRGKVNGESYFYNSRIFWCQLHYG